MQRPRSMYRSVGLAHIVLVFATACGGDGDDHAADAGADANIAVIGAEVMTESGPVRGVVEGAAARFLGIPYAAPPIGDRRFAPPVPPTPWAARDANAFGKACPQGAGTGEQGEDCLTINVWAHAGEYRARPVLVWVHGGGYVEGSSREPSYDGAQLARDTDTIVVTFNYRLGILGFLAHPSLVAADGGVGNWGLRDQIAALAWVKRNVAAFGGDPARVVIAGESAGGAAICTLLAAPAAQGLYAAAAMQSGSCRLVTALAQTSGTFPPARDVGMGIAGQLGCSDAACLRAAPVAAVLAADVPVAFDIGFPVGAVLPVVDGVVLDQRPMAAIRAGRGDVPLIVGANKEDASFFIVNAMGVTNTAGSFAQYLNRLPLTAQQRQTLSTMYPAAVVTEIGAATALATDIAFACPALALASVRPARARLYEFARQPATGIVIGYGAVHGLDFVYLFGTFAAWSITPTADDVALRDYMQRAWTSLAKTGEADASWPTAAQGVYQVLDATRSTATTWRGARCAQLASLGLLLDN